MNNKKRINFDPMFTVSKKAKKCEICGEMIYGGIYHYMVRDDLGKKVDDKKQIEIAVCTRCIKETESVEKGLSDKQKGKQEGL